VREGERKRESGNFLCRNLCLLTLFFLLFFLSQKQLSYLLKAYAFFNPEIGYCQGMGMVAGMLMMHMPTDVFFVSFLFFHLSPVLLTPLFLRTPFG